MSRRQFRTNVQRLVLVLASLGAGDQTIADDNTIHSSYAGEVSRAIKSLSRDDIDELTRGGGWGLARAAELNGVPGPAHLLEMKDEIPLDNSQILAITAVYDEMKSQAIRLGGELIAHEQELEHHFRNGTITDAILRSSLDDIAATRKELRYVHLSAHLKTPHILSQQQIDRYNVLRGYGDPCTMTPEGHDPALWREHSACD